MSNNPTLKHSIALALIPRFGMHQLHKLQAHVTDLNELFTASTAQLKQLGLNKKILDALANPPWQQIEAELAWAQQPQQHIISYWDPAYPPLLREISSPPIILYVKGRLELLHSPQIAMVGSRNPSPTGRETAVAFAKQLAQQGFTITSGLALGIDAACHHGALAAGGNTIAVMGTGLDIIYPPQHKELINRLLPQNVVLSEFSLGTPPKAANFPQRNRIISGLSLGVLVVEGALRSGSLITARCATEQGREVFAIPGSIHNPLAKGCHALIRQGAKLVETVADIVEELPAMMGFTATATNTEYDQPKQVIEQQAHNNVQDMLLSNIGYEVTSVDKLVERTQLPVASISANLLTLELEGKITSVSGGYVQLERTL